MKRRDLLGLMAAGVPLASARADRSWHDIDVTGSSPALEISMDATPDGKPVTQANFRGLITMLYFGYTFCPDVCPLTMQNIANVISKTGSAAKDIRFLFVTVDPGRDTIPVLKNYVAAFGPNFVGLRGTANQLTRLGQRYRVAWSVKPSPDPAKYEVTHSSAIYVFDRQLNARLLIPSMASQTPDINGAAADLVRLSQEKPSWIDWLKAQV